MSDIARAKQLYAAVEMTAADHLPLLRQIAKLKPEEFDLYLELANGVAFKGKLGADSISINQVALFNAQKWDPEKKEWGDSWVQTVNVMWSHVVYWSIVF